MVYYYSPEKRYFRLKYCPILHSAKRKENNQVSRCVIANAKIVSTTHFQEKE